MLVRRRGWVLLNASHLVESTVAAEALYQSLIIFRLFPADDLTNKCYPAVTNYTHWYPHQTENLTTVT